MYEKYWEEVARIFQEDPLMLRHTERVFELVRDIAGEAALPEREKSVAEIAAIFHDVGIEEAERKYGSREGRYQHLEGPPIARRILEREKEEKDILERVLFIVGHHHDFSAIDGMDFQVLVEADVLVNALEGKISKEDLSGLVERIFATEGGKRRAREILAR